MLHEVQRGCGVRVVVLLRCAGAGLVVVLLRCAGASLVVVLLEVMTVLVVIVENNDMI